MNEKVIKNLLVLFFSFTQLYGQESYVKIDYDRHLPSLSVYGICQGADGVVWVGTENGIAYFQNGFMHKVHNPAIPSFILRIYPCVDQGVYAVGNNPTKIIKVFKNGSVEEMPYAKIYRFTGALCTYNKFEKAIYYSDWTHIYRSTDETYDTVCAINGNGLISLETTRFGKNIANFDNRLLQIKDKKLIPIHHFPAASTCESGHDVFTSFWTNGLFHIRNDSLISTISWQNSHDIQPMHATCVGNKTWFVGLKSGLFCLENNVVDNIADHFGLSHLQFTYIFNDKKNNLWCATNGQGIIIIPNYKYLKNITQQNGLSDNFISHIFPCTRDTTIICTQQKMYKIIKRKNAIEMHQPQIDGRLQSNSDIYALSIFKRKLLFGLSKGNHNFLTPTSDGYALAATCIYCDSVNTILAGFSYLGYIKNEQITSSNEQKTIPVTRIPCGNSGRITSIIKVDSGYLYCGDGKISLLHNDLSGCTTLPCSHELGGYFLGLAQNSQNQVFTLTRKALYALKANQWHPILNYEEAGGQIFTDFQLDPFGHIWISTENGLLFLADNSISRITTFNGLPSNNIHTLEINKLDSSLWIGTAAGLSVLKLAESPLGTKFEHQLIFKQLIILGNNKKYSQATTLPHSENSLSIEFELQGYEGLAVPDYRFRLNQLNATWTQSQKSTVELLSLSSGYHQFEIQARIPGYTWSDSSIVAFNIAPPWWKLWETYLLSTALALIVTIILYKIRVNSLKNEERKKRNLLIKINELELRALSANMNPHFIFNALNSVQYFILPLKNRAATDFIANLSKLIRLNMEAVGKKLVNLKGELERIHLYVELEKERIDRPLLFDKNINTIDELTSIWLPSMIIQPAIENSIWHGIMPSNRDGIIKMDIIQNTQGFLEIKITDNGIGLKKSMHQKNNGHNSVAINLTKQRLTLQHPTNSYSIYEIYDNNGVSIGTQVHIVIKVK
ncbi:hypothetical protein GC194_11850 [bacterium]|nr:hypothetical protein [bacterium]